MNLLLIALLSLIPQGKITVARPTTIVHATVPLLPQIPWTASECPWVLKRPDGTKIPTQWEKVVTKGPNADSVQVAEILGYDLMPQVTGPVSYTLEKTAPVSDGRARPGLWAEAMFANPPPFKINGQAVALTWVGGEAFRSGSVETTRKFSGPHVFGWVTAYQGLDVLSVDVILHAAEPGSADFLFDSFGFATGSFESAWPEPLLQGGTLAPQRTDGAAKHVVCQRAARWWSGYWHNGTQTTLARALARGAGWGVSDQWQEVAAWQPHAMPLPELGYRVAQLKIKCSSDWAAISSALQNGTPYGMGVTYGGRKDIWHPYGPHYGGQTGGTDREQWIGVPMILSGEPDGMLAMQARMRMVMDRHYAANVTRDGAPQLLEAWLDPQGKPAGNWIFSDVDDRFQGSDGALAYSRQPIPLNRPPEYAELKQPIYGTTPSTAYSPMDFQHHDRATQMAVALAWGSNNPVAEWWLCQAAENWRWSFFSRGRLATLKTQTLANPGGGTVMGRAHAHEWTVSAAAYAVSGRAWRSRWDSSFADYRLILQTAQMPSNGLYRMHWMNKDSEAPPFGNGTVANWAITKSTEESLLASSIFATLGAQGVSGAARTASVDSLALWANSGLWRFLWKGGALGSAPTFSLGVRPLSWPGPVLGPPASDPNVIPRDHNDRTELASPLGMLLLERMGDPASVAGRKYAGSSATNTAALSWLKAQTLTKLELDDCAPLHRFFEVAP